MISVDRLTAIRSLGLRYLAGEHGGARLVTWAHACDLPDPWRWFVSGDLVMTTGGGLPVEPAQQAAWLDRLIDSGVSALVIAGGPETPAVTADLLAVADGRGFPVLAADFDLQFVTLARTVIESAVESERQRMATITRLYDMYWQALHARGDVHDRMSALEGVTGWALDVRDRDSGEILVSGRLAQRRRAAARTPPDEAPGRPGAVESPGDKPVEIAVPGSGEFVLSARPGRSPVTDRPLLSHLGGLIALELEYDAAHRDRLRASGEDLLRGLLDEAVPLAAVWPELRHRGMTGAVVMACWSRPDGGVLHHETVHRYARLQAYAPLLLARTTALIGIVPRDLGLLTTIAAELGQTCAVGISSPLTLNSDAAEAARQARLAAARAHEQRRPIAAYDDDSDDIGVLPRSVEDTRRLVRHVLGPLLAHDGSHEGDLVGSVRVFLRNDGAWQRSADELGIHRQTLVYRMRRIEQLTGLKPTSTEGSAMFWLAISGADRAGLALDQRFD